MTEDSKICPKCKGEMIKGHINELGMYNITRQVVWVSEKDAHPKFWSLRFSNKNQTRLYTYGCSKCGFTESYLDQNPPKDN